MRRGNVCAWTAVGVLGLSAGICGGLIGAEEPRADERQPHTTARSAGAGSVAELLELRRQLGPSPLEGTLLDRPSGETGDHAEFADALRREFDVRPSAPAVPLDVSKNISATSSPDAMLISTLRDAAWRLDEKAHRLEQCESYSDADDCRRLARRLRREARRLSAAASACLTDGLAPPGA